MEKNAKLVVALMLKYIEQCHKNPCSKYFSVTYERFSIMPFFGHDYHVGSNLTELCYICQKVIYRAKLSFSMVSAAHPQRKQIKIKIASLETV